MKRRTKMLKVPFPMGIPSEIFLPTNKPDIRPNLGEGRRWSQIDSCCLIDLWMMFLSHLFTARHAVEEDFASCCLNTP